MRSRFFGPSPRCSRWRAGATRLLDLAGDGQLDVVSFAGPTPGFYERTQDESWETIPDVPQAAEPRWDDPNLRFVDLDGDGHADILITENDVFTWYSSLGEDGFGPARAGSSTATTRSVGHVSCFADGTQSIYLADLSATASPTWCAFATAKSATGRTSATAASAPRSHGQRAVVRQPGPVRPAAHSSGRHRRLGDDRHHLPASRRGAPLLQPVGEPLERSAAPSDVPARSTTCRRYRQPTCSETEPLAWSGRRRCLAMRDGRFATSILMGGQKPHLLIRSTNNLGAETKVDYASSTKFYLEDKARGDRGSRGCRSPSTSSSA